MGQDQPMPAKREKNKEERVNIHDKPFFPARPGPKGKFGTLDKFPEHKADPARQIKRVKKEEDAPDPPPGFKNTYRYQSRPTPSIATNIRNLKSSYPSAFSRSPMR